jgi:hypothetical protein
VDKYSSQLLGVTVIPKKVTDFLRSTIYDSVSTREKDGAARADMLQLVMQASRETPADDATAADAKKTGETNGTWIFVPWDKIHAIFQ